MCKCNYISIQISKNIDIFISSFKYQFFIIIKISGMSKSNINITRKDAIKIRIKKMIKNGRLEITSKEELEEFDIGSLISFMNNTGIFKLGGFITKFADDFFIYITPDLSQKYRVRYVNIQKMWVGNPFICRNDLVSIVKTNQTKTNFPVKIGNIIVYYAQKKFDMDRFRCTDKFEQYIKWYKYFVDPEFTYE